MRAQAGALRMAMAGRRRVLVARVGVIVRPIVLANNRVHGISP